MPRIEDRYQKLETKVLPDGRTVYKPARPATVTGDPSTDEVIIANERDRLDIIAFNVYGSSLDWWRIAAANKHVNGSLHVKPGTKLIIPSK
jgi:nucleoid-associated protein YgaU